MADGENFSVDPGLMSALARHLEQLQRHPNGGDILRLIEDELQQCRERGLVNGSCLQHLHERLTTYTRQHALPSAVRLRVRLIQQHLTAYVPQLEEFSPKQEMESDTSMPDIPPVSDSSTQEVSSEKFIEPQSTSLEPTRAKPTHGPRWMRPQSTQTLPIEELRQMLETGMDEMQQERETLTRQLSDTTAYVKMIEAEREQLRVELNKARRRIQSVKKKPIKKALGLPKRDVLERLIESEVERVKRHGEPLALALIDINHPEPDVSKSDTEMTHTVMQHYSSEVLARFRSYDTVARYNKNEFAVLLPNTSKDSAMRALEKVRKRARETHFSHKGRVYPLPGFGGVLTFYSPGEEPQQMLRRADEALVNLKLRGERQLVVI